MKNINIFNKRSFRYWFGALMLLLITIVGCNKDYFDKQPLDSISDATFWKTEKDANLALIGCYNIGAGWTGENFWMPRSLLYLDLMAGFGSEKELIPDHVTDGTVTPSYGEISAYWSNSYNKIERCNNFLDHISTIPMEETTRGMMSSEVRTIRAYELFNMALYYGQSPCPPIY
ncbi:RagB/SusD family nutrient uptake outer membrane protein [Arachidicoccus ginsenosidivorans]|uniref:RagB/SusD family nutrient uptake outer membrane protein n=1 Tax=Arachidicoccus ginsenosidivorans TaxID=496057 RepID=UPI001CEF938F|nr:RagB/SusD family nutrient uptake outer membrane protein [Arachidicoccus ginsenosidivorans]